MKKFILLSITLLLCLTSFSQVNLKVGKLQVNKKATFYGLVIAPEIKGLIDTTWAQSFRNCEVHEVQIEFAYPYDLTSYLEGHYIKIKDARCGDTLYFVDDVFYITSSNYLETTPDPPSDLLPGFTITKMVKIRKLVIKNVDKISADTLRVTEQANFILTPEAFIQTFYSGSIAGWIMTNDRGDAIYVYPNSTGDGIVASTTKP